MGCDSPHPSLPIVHSPRLQEEHICIEDVQTDQDKLNGTMLSSESTFLPLTSDLEPRTTHSDSEDETETFEPDSLAPKWPPQPKKHSLNKTYSFPPLENEEKGVEEHVTCGAATSVAPPEVSISTPQDDPETISDTDEAKMGDIGACKPSLREAEKAAVKIQSWWRGQHTRCCHPAAKEVRSEIRLRRMQEHILFLCGKFDR